MDVILILVVLVVCAIIGLVGFMGLRKKYIKAAFETAEKESKAVLEDARRKAENLEKKSLKEAKDEARKRRKAFEDETKKRRTEYQKQENKIKQREQALEKRADSLNQKEAKLEDATEKLNQTEKRYHRLLAEYEHSVKQTQKSLEKIANMSVDEAKRELMKSLEEEARKEAAEKVREIESNMQKEAENKAQSVISLAVQRLAGEYVNDSSISVVSLPNEEMKGRIIGREGRNIRAIEQATGVDLIIDDTPEAVIISCFNPIRREMAKLTLEKLIADGRIHPARIDETALRVHEEFDQTLKEYGEQAAFDIGLTDLHPEILLNLGKLRFRTAGLQTVLQHSVETAHIAGMLAGELGASTKLAKRAGLLHDIGKALDQEVEGHHAMIGAQFLERIGEHEQIISAVRNHHSENLTTASTVSVILHAANTLSSSRPGARQDVLEKYIKRLEDMETIVHSFSGIDKAYVLQAGREVRAMVTSDGVADQEIVDISNDIASKIRSELTFPGQVKVTVLKESKYVDYAK